MGQDKDELEIHEHVLVGIEEAEDIYRFSHCVDRSLNPKPYTGPSTRNPTP
jgi:hypothetical protein